jgi:hypothetical protein
MWIGKHADTGALFANARLRSANRAYGPVKKVGVPESILGGIEVGKHSDTGALFAIARLRFVDRIYVQSSQTNPISWK